MEAITDPTGKKRRDHERALDRCLSENSPFGEAIFDFDNLTILRTNERFREAFGYKLGSEIHLKQIVNIFVPSQLRPTHIEKIDIWKEAGCPDLTLGGRGREGDTTHTDLSGERRDGEIIPGLKIEIRARDTDEDPALPIIMAWIIFPGTFGN